MQVRRLDVRESEDLVAQISEHANKLRTTQDELRTLREEMSRNRQELRKGAISRGAYDVNMRKMRQEEDRLRARIRDTVRKKIQLLSETEAKLKSHRVEPKKKRRKARRARRARSRKARRRR